MKPFLSILFLWLTTFGISHAQFIETNFETGVIWLPVKDAATHQLIRNALHEKDPLTRVQALNALAAIADPADVPLISSLREDPVPAVRLQAHILMKDSSIAIPPTPSPLLSLAKSLRLSSSVNDLRAALSHSNAVVQEAVVDSIGNHHVTELAPNLVPLLARSDSVLRRHICEALGKTGNDQGAPLASQLATDEDPFVQHAAGNALVALHTDTDREALIALLKNSRSIVRAEAVAALGQWAQPDVALVLHPFLNDPDWSVVKATAIALGQLGNPESKAPLMAVLPKNNTIAQERMAWALGELHATEAVPVMLPLFHNGSPLTETSMAEALGKIGDPAAIPTLQKVLTEMTQHSPNVRTRAMEALRKLGDRNSTPRILQIITEKVIPPPPGTSDWSYDMDDTRAEGLRYLEFIGDPSLITNMISRLKDMPTYTLRKAMANYITHIRGTPYIAAFSIDVRHYWIESLTVIPLPVPTPPGILPAP